MTEPMIVALIASMASFGASGGLWAYIAKRSGTRSAMERLTMGLAYDKIVSLGMAYIQRGWISKDEYEELRHNLFDPYKELGGNGLAEKVMTEVGVLPFRVFQLSEIIAKEQNKNNG